MAQTRSVGATIVDAETGEAMECVNVYASTSGKGTITNVDGRFSISGVDNGEIVRLSFVGYKTVTMKASEVRGKIKMEPLSKILNEATVLSDDAIINKIVEKLKKDYMKNQNKRRMYFNRLTYQNKNNTEMIESFIDAESAVHLRELKVASGNHWALNRMGDEARSSFEETDLHLLLSLGPMIRREDSWNSTVEIPFPKDFSVKSLKKKYIVTRIDTDEDPETADVMHLRFKSKEAADRTMEGDLFVDPLSLQMLRFQGKINNVQFTRGFQQGKNSLSQVNDISIDFNINYKCDKGFTEVSDMTFHVYDNGISFKSILTDVSHLDLPIFATTTIGNNLLKDIEAAGYSPDAFEKYSIVERTEEEQKLVDANNGEDVQIANDLGTAMVGEIAAIDKRPDNVLMQHIKRTMNFNDLYPQEKVYLHLDNTAYFKGETIWFKAYVKRADEDVVTDISSVLYVELLNPQGDVVEKRKLPIVRGVSKGDITVDSIMTTGFYEIRAYTRYMTNWGSDACFSRVIPIFKAPQQEGNWNNPAIDLFSHSKRLNNEREKEEKLDRVTFYPEGGNLIKGLTGRVAVLATDKDGKPMEDAFVEVEGEGGRVMTDSFGRAVVTVPANNMNPQVVITDSLGNSKTYSLPAAISSGVALKVDADREDVVNVEINASEDLQGSAVAYVVMNGGKVVRCDTLSLANTSLKFNRHLLPKGVNQFTLFNHEGRILAERLFFVHPADAGQSTIGLKSTTQVIKPCGKVEFDVKSKPFSNISFSAVDAAGLVNGPHGNINTYMLLDSELKGFISRPEYYLEADDEEHRSATDRLMMVQGWRRYDWQLMSGQMPFDNIQPSEDRLYLSGKVIAKKKNDKNVPLELGVLFSRMGVEPFGDVLKTDSLGRFAFALPNLANDWDLRLVARNGEETVKSIITIDRNFAPKSRFISEDETSVIPVDDLSLQQWNVDEADSARWIVTPSGRDRMLKTVTVKAKGRFWDRTNWSNERVAEVVSDIRYDCDEASDIYADKGIEAPEFAQFLVEKNSFFSGNSTTVDTYLAMPDGTPLGEDAMSYLQGGNTDRYKLMSYDDIDPQHTTTYDIDPPTGWVRMFGDGLSYKNRPIMWIVDNQFCTFTNIKKGGREVELRIFENDNKSSTRIDLPTALDDVKTVFISDKIEPMRNHFNFDRMDSWNPIGVYVYTHRHGEPRQKDARYTHYQGYNMPSKFKMEDYSTLPPMEDFRRTVYWNPNVITDANGNAHVEFWNNSSCTQMYISAEGMTKDGTTLTFQGK